MRRPALSLTLVVALILAGPGARVAAESDAAAGPVETVLRRGDLIRLTTRGDKPRQTVGTVQRVEGDSITLRTRRLEVVSLRLRGIDRVERRTGTRGNLGYGLLIGAALGAAVGLGYVAALSEAEAGGASAADLGTGLQLGALIGAGAGGLIGLVIARTDVWRDVPIGAP